MTTIHTPITLDRLDGEHAVFTGTAEETTEHHTLFGSVEVSGHYPAVFVQRTVWEDIGCPTALILTLEEPPR